MPRTVDSSLNLLIFAEAALRIGEAIVDANKLPGAQAAELLRTIATEQRALASKVDALANQLDPISEVEIVVTCRHCGDSQPTPIDWSAPCRACGGVR